MVTYTHKRSSSDNASTARKEISANNVLQNRAFTTRLGADNSNLRQVDWIVHSNGQECILKLVNWIATTEPDYAWVRNCVYLEAFSQHSGAKQAGAYLFWWDVRPLQVVHKAAKQIAIKEKKKNIRGQDSWAQCKKRPWRSQCWQPLAPTLPISTQSTQYVDTEFLSNYWLFSASFSLSIDPLLPRI